MKLFRSNESNEEKKVQINKNIEKAHRIKNRMQSDFLKNHVEMKKINQKLMRTTAYKLAIATGGLKPK